MLFGEHAPLLLRTLAQDDVVRLDARSLLFHHFPIHFPREASRADSTPPGESLRGKRITEWFVVGLFLNGGKRLENEFCPGIVLWLLMREDNRQSHSMDVHVKMSVAAELRVEVEDFLRILDKQAHVRHQALKNN